MIINETTLGELCTRVAKGDQEARHDFDRHVLPVVEAIVGRWLTQQRPTESQGGALTAGRAANLLPKVAGAICAQMIAQAAGERRTRRRRQGRHPGAISAAGETLSALIERHTASRLIPWPA